MNRAQKTLFLNGPMFRIRASATICNFISRPIVGFSLSLLIIDWSLPNNSFLEGQVGKMSQSDRTWSWQLLVSGLALGGAIFASWGDCALAQLKPVPDDTLGSENSVVTPINSQVDRIDGGARRGANLFHSFREFNIDEGRG
ncbi:MAG: hypothetical protein ACRDEA_18575, partial [Microcystaceae cyanobacterium]